MKEIFIGYRVDDASGWAAFLKDELSKEFGRNNVFLDKDALNAGSYEKQIEKALGRCGAMLVVVGPKWLDAKDREGRRRLEIEKDLHRREVALALARPQLLIIPVLVDGARMPDGQDLPSDLRELTSRQSRELSAQADKRRIDLELIKKDLRNAVGGWRLRRSHFAAGVIVVIAVAAMAVLAVPPRVDLTAPTLVDFRTYRSPSETSEQRDAGEVALTVPMEYYVKDWRDRVAVIEKEQVSVQLGESIPLKANAGHFVNQHKEKIGQWLGIETDAGPVPVVGGAVRHETMFVLRDVSWRAFFPQLLSTTTVLVTVTATVSGREFHTQCTVDLEKLRRYVDATVDSARQTGANTGHGDPIIPGKGLWSATLPCLS